MRWPARSRVARLGRVLWAPVVLVNATGRPHGPPRLRPGLPRRQRRVGRHPAVSELHRGARAGCMESLGASPCREADHQPDHRAPSIAGGSGSECSRRQWTAAAPLGGREQQPNGGDSPPGRRRRPEREGQRRLYARSQPVPIPSTASRTPSHPFRSHILHLDRRPKPAPRHFLPRTAPPALRWSSFRQAPSPWGRRSRRKSGGTPRARSTA